MPNLYDSSTNKQGLFIFNGEASDDFGIVIAKAPNFEKAIRKSSAVDIPGRNGSVVYGNGLIRSQCAPVDCPAHSGSAAV